MGTAPRPNFADELGEIWKEMVSEAARQSDICSYGGISSEDVVGEVCTRVLEEQAGPNPIEITAELRTYLQRRIRNFYRELRRKQKRLRLAFGETPVDGNDVGRDAHIHEDLERRERLKQQREQLKRVTKKLGWSQDLETLGERVSASGGKCNQELAEVVGCSVQDVVNAKKRIQRDPEESECGVRR